jgi:hypothetical protein
MWNEQIYQHWAHWELLWILQHLSGLGSVVGIATAYGLDGPGIEPGAGEIFRTSPDRP